MRGAERARADDIEQLVELQCALFREDAHVHDRFADRGWPRQESAADLGRMLDDPRSRVLVVRSAGGAVGYLAGYLVDAPPTRLPALNAVLRSLYVQPDHRGRGVAGRLTEAFVGWARDNGCVQVTVDSYVANEPARRLYERHGFVPQSIRSALTLT